MNTLLRGYAEMNEEWIAPFNGYQYKLYPVEQDWTKSRSVCRKQGGDLAVYGIRNLATRM